MIHTSDRAAQTNIFKDATSFLFQMTTITISPLGSDDSNLFSPLTAEEAENIKGGRLPSEVGSGSKKAREASSGFRIPPPLNMPNQFSHTEVIGRTEELQNR